jgi:hypothetical protein
MNKQQQQLVHLRMIRASTKMMLTNLQNIADEETINEMLDTLNKLTIEIDRIEDELKQRGE